MEPVSNDSKTECVGSSKDTEVGIMNMYLTGPIEAPQVVAESISAVMDVQLNRVYVPLPLN